MEFIDLARKRRSIRKYKSDPVPDDALRKVLEGVRWAPSWANTQCWEVILVKDPKAKSEILRAVPETNRAHSAMTEAPIILVLCGKKAVSGYSGGKPATPKGDWLMFDTGLAMQNLCLAAHAVGLGTVIVGFFDHKKAEEILSLPESVEFVAMTPLGYPAAEGSPRKRKEFPEFIFYDKYPQK